MQLFSLTFITLAACVSTPPPDLNPFLPEGYYSFDCPIIYEKGMVRLRHDQAKVRVELLEKFDGSFSFSVRSDQTLTITDADMGFPGLNRSFRGEGTLTKRGHAAGRAVSWLKTGGPLSRNHREGPWTLRPATPREIQSFERQQKQLEERKARAREAGLDI
ncbi:MAG: hypothetical protein PF795_02550 [Kiritimatiellae bacterium]|nr:hypothetical protein [Kiritimatiellia bacterium]